VKARVVNDYLCRHYLPGLGRVQETGAERSDDEKIFSIWLQGEQNAPDLVKACFASIRRNCTQELVVLDEQSLEREIQLPPEIVRKYKSGKMKPAHYSDICRVELLHKYGGYWLDATCYVTAPIPQVICDQEFFVYLTGNKVSCSYSFMQNCFIRARKGSYLLECWRRMILDYWMNENGTMDYLQHQLMFRTIVMNHPPAADYFSRMPHIDQDPTHVLWWTIRNEPYTPESFRKATAGAFYQKTSYLDAADPQPGTIMHRMIYGNP